MEKRALLAFVLIIMTWIGYYYLVYPMYTTSPNPELTEETSISNPTSSFSGGQSFSPVDTPGDFSQEQSNLDDTKPPFVSDRNSLAIESNAVMFADSWDRSEQVALLQNESSDVIPKDIVIESEYFRGVINTRGANITSWQLKKYKGLDAPWVELIPQDREFGPEIILTSEEGPYSFQNVVYDSDQDVLNLNEIRKQRTLVFSARTKKGLTIKKEYIFNHDNYVFEIKVNIDGGGFIPLGSKYYLRWGGGIRITEQDSDRDLQAFKGFAQIGDTVIGEDDLGTSIEDPRPETTGDLRWTGVRSKYFLIALIPHDKISKGYRLNGRPVNDGNIQDRQISVELSMNLSSPLNDTFLIYLGPVHYETLEMYGFGLENAVDLGWSVISPFSKIALSTLVWLHQFISNYGIVIIVLSILVKIILYPLTYKSLKATQGMQKLQPKMASLKEKYKNDSKKLNKEMMKLYKDGGVNPIGGCLPMVLQMPILFALYTVFSSTIELRGEPFIENIGPWTWISDLSLKDPIYILPVLMGVTMLLQSKMTMKDPRQAMFIYVMPLVLFFIMKDLPSGLILYWTMINILTIIQQYIQNRFFPSPPAPA